MMMPGTLSTITAASPPPEEIARGLDVGRLRRRRRDHRFARRRPPAPAVELAFDLRHVGHRRGHRCRGGSPVLPEYQDEEHDRSDRLGALFTAIAVGSLVHAIIEGSEKGWTEPVVIAAMVITVLGLAAYAFMGMRSAAPLLDPRLFGDADSAPGRSRSWGAPRWLTRRSNCDAASALKDASDANLLQRLRGVARPRASRPSGSWTRGGPMGWSGAPHPPGRRDRP